MTRVNQSLVSVIIPAWNSETVIDDAIESVVSQTYEDLEIIIINDASTDRTGDIADEWARKDERIRVVHNTHNLGIGANRKKGIEEARGQFICWQDADDISYSDRVERQVAMLQSDESIGVVGGFLQFFDKNGDGVVRTYDREDLSLRQNIFKYNPVAQPATMFRREVFDVVGSYNEKLPVSEDLDMFLRLGEKYTFANVQGPVIRYRQSDSSLTASRLKDMERATLRLRSEYRKSPAYAWTFSDTLYNMAQKMTMWIPVSVRMKLFAVIRGDKRHA